MDLEDALQRVRAGDQDAYAVVIEHTERRLRACLALRVPDREIVDECAHQAYITAYEKLNDYRSNTQFEAWLTQIALFHLRNARRKRGPAQAGALERLANLVAPSAPDSIELSDDVDRLRHCLGKLQPSVRQVIDLRYQECLDPSDIARKLGRNAASVRSVLTRVRQSLRQCMEAVHAI